MNIIDTAIEKIEKQQIGTKGSAVYYVGEQLKDICRESEHNADIVSTDLDNPKMSIAKCEIKIAEYASQHKNGKSGCCPPQVADSIIRKFYGLPAPGEAPTKSNVLDLSDFL